MWEPVSLSNVCLPDSNLTACSYFGYAFLNLLVNLYGKPQVENTESKHLFNESYDFIIVGAGSSGCVVAEGLSKNPKWRVLLLEAGGEEPIVTIIPGLTSALIGSSSDWQFTTEPNGKSCLANNGRCLWPRGKGMGGSSSINSMSYIRGNRGDYDHWAELGNVGWGYDEVLPYFKKSERNLEPEVVEPYYHGFNGEQPVARYPYIDQPSKMLTAAFIERGLPLIDYNGAEQEGVNQAQAFVSNGRRRSANKAFIEPIRNKTKNLVIKINSKATKILIKNMKAYGIEYENNGTVFTALASKEVIISAGAINSPQLLMWSGIGLKDQLESVGIPVMKNLSVGKNLHDHVTFDGIFIALPNKTATRVSNEEVFEYVENFFVMDPKENPLSGNGPLNTIAFLKSKADLRYPDVQYQVGGIHSWRELLANLSSYLKVQILPTPFYDGLSPRTQNLQPISRGDLQLNPKDIYGYPLINPNYFGDEEDLLTLLRGVDFILSLRDTEAFKESGAYFIEIPLPPCDKYKWGTKEYFICLMKTFTGSTYHPVGTCKMGPEYDSEAVVDSKLKVYGVDRLRVIDGSIMPRAPSGNTNAACLLIGELGAEFIINYWKEKCT
ncbi:unnamed protein product [Pieris brassicae]|uniref:Glucose-methanol-choline oxidoreductase N-terminal domain-containing protein n=1 Tax=Pieris brassicae TaxID=7116 RepID=A0A9P0TGT2_PIEBR|nr:unnamed protein product [Pieris brassicae]